MLIDNQVTGSLALFRGALLRRALPFPPPTDLAFHDHWLAVCATLEEGVRVLPDVVQDYVQHDGNVIGEMTNNRLSGRFRHLRSVSNGSVSGQLNYLRQHRWGWRVHMARTAIVRYPYLTKSQARHLVMYAENRFTIGLMAAYALVCLSRQAPVARSMALVLGSLRLPRTHQPEARV